LEISASSVKEYFPVKCFSKIENTIGLIDVIPTIFDILGFKVAEKKSHFAGESILPLIYNNSEDSRIRISDTRLPMDINRLTSLRSDNYKYIFIQDTKNEYFFDLKKDPNESKNCIGELGYFDFINKPIFSGPFGYPLYSIKFSIRNSRRSNLNPVNLNILE